MMKRHVGIIAGVLATTLVLSGCASTEEPESEPDAAVESTTETSDSEAAEQDSSEPEETESEPESAVDSNTDPLRLGYLLPITGPLDFLGKPTIAGVELAVQEINAAGGVLGNDIEILGADEANDRNIASEEANRLISSGVKGIIGAAATGMTMAVVDDIASAGIVQCSPSNTGIGLTTQPDSGYYFRTAASDVTQAPVLAELVAEAGYETVAITARADDYGVPFLEQTSESLAAKGVTVVLEEFYDPDSGSLDTVYEAMVDSGAEAHVIISFSEGAGITQGLLDSGIEGNQLFGADGIAGAAFSDNFASAEVLEGMSFTAPTAIVPESFESRLLAFKPDLEDFLFSPQSYDCVNLMALSAAVSGSTASESIRDNMIAITNGDNACSTFAECLEFVEAGESISYQSAVEIPLNFIEVREGGGDPSRSFIETYVWENGEFTTKGVRVGNLLG